MNKQLPGPLLFFVAVLAGCQTQHEVKTETEIKPVLIRTEHKIEPIHITVDVNLKIDRELDDFFSELDEKSPLILDIPEATSDIPTAQ